MPAAPWAMLGVPTQPAPRRADMSEIFIGWANGGFTQAVAAGALFGLCNWLVKRWQTSSDAAKSQLRRTALHRLSIGLYVLQHFFVFGFLWTVLEPLLAPDTPPSRTEVFRIAFWTVMGVAAFVSLFMGPSGGPRAMRRAKHQPESCSTEPESPQVSADTLPNSPTASIPATTRPTGSEGVLR